MMYALPNVHSATTALRVLACKVLQDSYHQQKDCVKNELRFWVFGGCAWRSKVLMT